MERKLFCEYGALAYWLAVVKCRVARRIKDLFSAETFAAQKTDKLLPVLTAKYRAVLYKDSPLFNAVSEKNKVVNVNIAYPKVSGILIKPGETFSFWKMIGKPTKGKGYVDGVTLVDGGFSSGLGGGLCHLSGVIYWASLHTPLTITERHRHGYDTTPQKFFGSDATCFYNYKDVMIKNETKHDFQLKIDIDDVHLTATWLSNTAPMHSYEIYEKESYVHEEDWGVTTRHNIVHRRIFDLEGKQVGDEFVARNNAIVMKP